MKRKNQQKTKTKIKDKVINEIEAIKQEIYQITQRRKIERIIHDAVNQSYCSDKRTRE